MKWLPKEKRNPFILVVVITAVTLILIYFGLLSAQSSILARVKASRQSAAAELQGIEKTIKNADATTNELATVAAALERALAAPLGEAIRALSRARGLEPFHAAFLELLQAEVPGR